MIRYYFTTSDCCIHLEWDKVDNATKYIVYRKVVERENNLKELNEVFDEEIYTDNNIEIDNIYPPEISIVNQKDYGIIKVFIVDNARNKRTYQYHIIAYDKDNNIIKTMETDIELFNKPDRYYYYLRNIKDTDSIKEKKISEDGCVILNSIENGNYVFYAAAEYNQFASEFTSARIQIDNTIFINNLECDIPNWVKYNNRYRGPQESKKKDNFINIAKNNISKLKKRYEALERYQKNLYMKPDVNNNTICNIVDEIETSMNDIRGVIKYEQRNN